MSHHYSGPNIGFPRGDARLDLTDLYAFPKPGDPGKSILIMDFHPSVGVNPPGPTTAEPFAPEARYELKIDTDGDAVANITYEVCFAPVEGGGQTARLRRFEGAQPAETGGGGKVIVEGMPVSIGHEAHVAQAGDHRLFAGWRSDPFFFDVLGTLDNFQFKAGDFFADKDICSIVLEVPNSLLGPKEVGLWARTLIPDSAGGGWIQADRGARPSQTPFLSGEQNDAYLAGEPADDARFVPVFAHALEHTGGYTSEEATRVAEPATSVEHRRESFAMRQRKLQQRQNLFNSLRQAGWVTRRVAEADKKTDMPRDAIANLTEAREINEQPLLEQNVRRRRGP